jgi:hypothetical protein
MFNRFPKRELFYSDAASLGEIIDRLVNMSSDDEIAVTTRQGAGYRAVCVAFSNLRYSHKAEEDLKRTLETTFGPISFNTWADCGVSALVVFYFNESTLDHPIDVERVRRITESVITTWVDRSRGAGCSGNTSEERVEAVFTANRRRRLKRLRTSAAWSSWRIGWKRASWPRRRIR